MIFCLTGATCPAFRLHPEMDPFSLTLLPPAWFQPPSLCLYPSNSLVPQLSRHSPDRMILLKCRTDDVTRLLKTLQWLHLTQSKHQCPPNGPQSPTPPAPPHSLSDHMSYSPPLFSPGRLLCHQACSCVRAFASPFPLPGSLFY